MAFAKEIEAMWLQEALDDRSIASRIDEMIEATDVLAAKLQKLRANQAALGAELIAYQIEGMRKAIAQLIGLLANLPTDGDSHGEQTIH